MPSSFCSPPVLTLLPPLRAAATPSISRMKPANIAVTVEAQDGLVLHLLSFLDLSEVTRLSRVSKTWQTLCTSVISSNFPAKKDFQTGEELQDAVNDFCSKYENCSLHSKHAIDAIASTYGYPINKWRVGKVQDFSNMFRWKNQFNEYIGDWDTSSATSNSGMFMGASSFNQDLANGAQAKLEIWVSCLTWLPRSTSL